MTELLEKLAADVGGRYVVERELGRGGMATVYLARDLLDERRVAIKVMDPELSAAVGAERFKREIDVASRLQHPHILGILGSGEAAGTSYYVMPYVQGETLRDRLEREKQLPIEDAIRIAREVADALDYAHKQGIVHRDIKPENILLENGRALVADFGIARAASMGDAQKLTKTGTALGTPHYMSPEQIFGEKDIDGRTDEYALACMLHEMLAGQPPFVGPHAQSLMAQHALDDPPLVSRFRATTPSNVEDAIYTALAKTRADRFPTLHDFTVALENTGYTSMMKITRMQRAATQSQLQAIKKPVPVWKKAAVVAAGLVLVLGGTAAAWNYIAGTKGGELKADEAVKLRRLAVMYFKAAPDGDLPVLADALTDAVIARLRTVPALTVASRNAVAPLRGTDLANDSVARLLDVGALVTGNVRRDGKRVRVDVQVVNADNTPLVDLSVSDTVGGAQLAETLADSVTRRLRLVMGKVGREVQLKAGRASTENLSAWTSFQRGQQLLTRADSLLAVGKVPGVMASLDSADARYRESIALDPSWSAPVAGRAFIAFRRARLLDDAPAQAAPWLDSAEALGKAAVAIDESDADAHEMLGSARAERVRLGLVQGADADAMVELAKIDLNEATTLNPTQASAWSTLSRLAYTGSKRNASDAKSLALKAYEADAYLADAPSILGRLFIISHDQNEYQDAQKYCNEGHRRFPRNWRFTECQLMVLTMPNASPRPGEAWRLVDSLRAMRDSASWPLEGRMAAMYAAVSLLREGIANPGRRQALVDSARKVVARNRGDASIDPRDELMGREAFVLAQLGDRTAALDLLERYVSKHPEHIQGFKTGTFWGWDPLKNEPRFQNILRLAK